MYRRYLNPSSPKKRGLVSDWSVSSVHMIASRLLLPDWVTKEGNDWKLDEMNIFLFPTSEISSEQTLMAFLAGNHTYLYHSFFPRLLFRVLRMRFVWIDPSELHEKPETPEPIRKQHSNKQFILLPFSVNFFNSFTHTHRKFQEDTLIRFLLKKKKKKNVGDLKHCNGDAHFLTSIAVDAMHSMVLNPNNLRHFSVNGRMRLPKLLRLSNVVIWL